MIKDIYILHVDGQLAFYHHSKTNPSYGFAPQDEFINFVKSLREDYPEHRLRCIKNEGIENYLRKKLSTEQKLIEYYKQCKKYR